MSCPDTGDDVCPDPDCCGVATAVPTVYGDGRVTLHHGECVEVMRTLPDNSIDAIVTDPPYGLGFMGKGWDSFDSARDERARGGSGDKGILPGYGRGGSSSDRVKYRDNESRAFGQWCEGWTAEAFRVLKPGGHLLAFGGTRTWHRLAVAVEDAGFEVRDSIAWLYGSGFPKSLDVSKAIDKAAGHWRGRAGEVTPDNGSMSAANYERTDKGDPITPDAARWQGWGTALKPAFEPIVVGRKPLAGTVAANVLAHGTGALNIDACRVGTSGGGNACPGGDLCKCETSGVSYSPTKHPVRREGDFGRWPANVVLDTSQAAELDEQSGITKSTVGKPRQAAQPGEGYGMTATGTEHADKGGASRFFATFQQEAEPCANGTGAPTAATSPNGTTSAADTADTPDLPTFRYVAKAPTKERVKVDGIAHPTVKPLGLMRWLVKLVTPPGGVVLEPFAGSGTTLEAAALEGFACIGIEREPTYLPLINARMERVGLTSPTVEPAVPVLTSVPDLNDPFATPAPWPVDEVPARLLCGACDDRLRDTCPDCSEELAA